MKSDGSLDVTLLSYVSDNIEQQDFLSIVDYYLPLIFICTNESLLKSTDYTLSSLGFVNLGF